MKNVLKPAGVLAFLCGMALCFGLITWKMTNFQKQGRVFGLCCMTMNNDFYKVIETELKAKIQASQDILMTRDPQMNLDRQIEQIESLMQENVDGLFINPIDSAALQDVLTKAQNRNIPVIILDAPVVENSPAIATIASDNYQAGVLCAQDLMERKESARIALLLHSEVASARDRIEGFETTLAQNGAYEVVARAQCRGQLEEAMPAMLEILEEHPEVDVIMALNDPSALGALAALDLKGRNDVLVYGVDGTPEVKKKISENGSMTATAAQSPKGISQKAVEAMYSFLEGKTVSSWQEIPVYLIDKENVEQFSLTRWQ